ncbi:MAG: hypothetical protein AcusKO_04590 [Acuticoccus sp.]
MRGVSSRRSANTVDPRRGAGKTSRAIAAPARAAATWNRVDAPGARTGKGARAGRARARGGRARAGASPVAPAARLSYVAAPNVKGNRAILDRFDLSGRLALVTGASRGIGQALASGLAAAGADIIATGRSAAGLADTVAAVTAAGRRATPLSADLLAPGAVAGLFDTLAARGLAPTILVNNAGTEDVAPAREVSEAQWDAIVGTNLKAAFFVAQAFARQCDSGAIINLGSLTSAVGIPTAVPYTASKSGVLGMTRALAAEWAPDIRVNALGPGYFRTAMTEGFYESAEWREAMLGKIPMRRFGDLDDLVGAAVFLASDASAYVTGQILYVDGGTLASL